jgi:predicted amidohydrolase YtcJ
MSQVSILKAASVITMDPASPRAEAVAFDTQTGRINLVGSLSDCQSAYPDAAVADLGDTVLMPGFVEAHNHPFVSGTITQSPAYWIAPYVGYPSWSDLETLFRKLDKEQPAGEPLLFSGLDRMLQEVDEPDNVTLDKYFPHRPILIVDNSGHEVYFNSATIDMLGWSDKPPADPTGARFGRNPDGSSNGRAYEMGAMAAVTMPMISRVVTHPLFSAAQWFALMSRNGITATSDMTYSSDFLTGYEALASTRNIPLRISFYHVSYADDAGEELKSKAPATLLRKQGIKLWGDGSPWVGNVANSFAYLDTPTVRRAGIPLGPAGLSAMNYTRRELDQILDEFAPQGWQMSFHINGDVGIDTVLDAYEEALVRHNLKGTDHRWRIEHCGAGRADQFQRAADLGVTVSLGPFQFIYWGDLLDGQIFPSEIGSEWMQFAGAQEAGVEPSFHNDGSVSPPIPLLNIQTAITRMTPSGKVHGPDQIISLEDALKSETINAARQLFQEKDIGSIEAGKLADFVELSSDPYLADPTRLTEQVQVRGTWLSGHRIDLDDFLAEVKAVDPSEHAHLAKPSPHAC